MPTPRDTVVGHLTQVWRYPVKSMAGESLAAAELDWHGVAGDRRWAFVRPDRASSGFPWLTVREVPAMARHDARLLEPERPDGSAVEVTTPDGERLDVADPALAARLGEGLRVMKQARGVFDEMPLSLLTTQALGSLGALVDVHLDVRRFRPTLVVTATDGDWPEEAWVGHTFALGAAVVRVDQRDPRCVMVDLEPETGERQPQVLRTLARERAACLGVYGSVVRPGTVAPGDPLVLLD